MRPVAAAIAAGRAAPRRSSQPRMSWLCPTPAHRQRFLEIQPKVRIARLSNIVAATTITGLMAPHVGWTLVLTFVVMVAIVLTRQLPPRTPRTSRAVGVLHDRRQHPDPATASGAGVTLASLWKASDTALYAAKRAGRNGVEVFDAELAAAA